MTVKLCGLIYYHSEYNAFCSKCFIYYETYPYSSVHITIREARIQCVCLQYTFLMFRMFRYSYILINT